jgi:hypothetical protein
MSALLISAVAAGGREVPDGVGKVKSRPARTCEPLAVGAVRRAGVLGNCAGTENVAGAKTEAGAISEPGAGTEVDADGVFVGVVFEMCTALDWPINHCKAASSRP